MKPLADKVRPQNIKQVVGQQHLLGKDKILSRIISSRNIVNMIFYGPPGTGKTTVANIIASETKKRFYKLNATNASVKDIKEIIKDTESLFGLNGVILYLDEIQNFNKKQQQSLLEFIENGKITLIASTTENPYFYVYNAILSRATVFEFKSLEKKDIIKGLKRAVEIASKDLGKIEILCDDSCLGYVADISNGDLRKAINIIELAIYYAEQDSSDIIKIDIDVINKCMQEKFIKYDKFGDNHYDLLSAFQKSIRGSDPDAAIHYLARLIKSGDLISICRRLLVTASEDVGMAYPNAITIVKSCVDVAMQLGFPEARIPLSQAVLTLATAPKSNSAIKAIDAAINDIETKDVGQIPMHLRDSHYGGAASLGRGNGYKYPHNYSNNYIMQQYIPNALKDSVYYVPGNNKIEQKIMNYQRVIKKK